MAQVYIAEDGSITKECTRCGRILPADRFTKVNYLNCGLRSHCKECHAGGAYKIRPRKQAKAEGRTRYFGRPCPHGHSGERVVWNGSCVECNKLNWKKYETSHKEELEVKRRAYYATPACKKRQAAYARWYAENKKEILSANRARRWARVNNAPGQFTPDDIVDIFNFQSGRCPYCSADLNENGYHVDHIIALSKGGTNYRVNIQLCCPTCNMSKNNKDPIVFAQSKGTPLVCDLQWKLQQWSDVRSCVVSARKAL